MLKENVLSGLSWLPLISGQFWAKSQRDPHEVALLIMVSRCPLADVRLYFAQTFPTANFTTSSYLIKIDLCPPFSKKKKPGFRSIQHNLLP